MRRFVIIIGIFMSVLAVAVLVAAIWVDRALAAVQESPEILCLTQKDREKIASGNFVLARQDTLVSKAVNFDQGVPRGHFWWHLRGATIHLTYVTFWSPAKRGEVFNRLTSKMRDCPPSLQR